MRGAVLHGLFEGLPTHLNPVTERKLRRSYGIKVSSLFDPEKHPQNLKYFNEIDDTARCITMHWFAKKVETLKLLPLG
jgi:hypothetical protein